MHRGVRELLAWFGQNVHRPDVKLAPPTSEHEVERVEQHLGAPLPTDYRWMVLRQNGGTTPLGRLIPIAGDQGPTVEDCLRELATATDRSPLDGELMLPFFRTDSETYLCFDRSAAPVSDLWPIIDYDPKSGELRMVHRTFDGWCRLQVSEWTSPDFEAEFTVESYLRQGKRHSAVEPDVSVAHVTVAHALRRAGEPDLALDAYLKAGRLTPSVPWADWEALKLASLLKNESALFEAISRLAQRATPKVWALRDTTPARVTFIVAKHVRGLKPEERKLWVRFLDKMEAQSLDDNDRQLVHAIAEAASRGEEWLPVPTPRRASVLPPNPNIDAWWQSVVEGYREGSIRDEDLILDSNYALLTRKFSFRDLLRVRRDF